MLSLLVRLFNISTFSALNSIAEFDALPIFFLIHIWKLLRSYPLTRIFSFDYSARVR